MPSANTNNAAAAEWLAVDWGTSRLRVWGIDSAGAVAGKSGTAGGATDLERDMFEPSLLSAAAEFLPDGKKIPALICGMAGARNRWQETPYLSAPCSPLDAARNLTEAPSRAEKLFARILPGISQESPCDVMRGEETQIAGLLSVRPDFCGVACLPGTHTKWARIENGKIKRFTTLMSGEMYYLFAKVSVLRRSVASGSWDEDVFLEAAETTLAHPEKTAAVLFSIRAESLLRGLSKSAARARLSGYWMGLELAATREYWAGGHAAVVGENVLRRQYEIALAARGVKTEMFAAEEMSLAGLLAMRAAADF